MPTPVVEAGGVSPEEYVRQLEAIQAAATLRTERDLLAMRRALRGSLREVRQALAGWDALAGQGDRTGMMMVQHLGDLERRLGRVLDELQQVVLERMSAAWRRYWDLGVSSVVGPAETAGLLLVELGIEWARQELLERAVPQMVQDVTALTRRRLAQELRRSMLLGEDRRGVYARMVRLLAGNPERHELGRFGGWLYQAERIHRTESHRLYHQGQDAAARRWRDAGAQTVKVWRHSHARTVYSRPEHIAMDRQLRGIDQRYSNGLRYPVDPEGSADQTINCMCYQQVLPVETARALGYTIPESMSGGLDLPQQLPPEIASRPEIPSPPPVPGQFTSLEQAREWASQRGIGILDLGQDLDLDRVNVYLRRAALLPDAAWAAMRRLNPNRATNLDIIPGGAVTAHPARTGLRGVAARGWQGETWDAIPGAGGSSAAPAVVALDGSHGSVSILLHEAGHTLDHALGGDLGPLSSSHAWRVLASQTEGTWGSYYEFFDERWAECLAAYLREDWDYSLSGLTAADREKISDYFRGILGMLQRP